ncbi:hypothetical protein EOPP23_05810 [Endozoicomonas sp. OPT23]|uniref:peptide deformylase n=1 Tax=Endozoicomonas sp. OPT23 TaxID=2072845 RepID=UPI00129C01E0|nr:peptide deformylase [Endozoicomonas sp. OPT23]MRI32500.1 hypothetical protein [Endozoicomonas sp. OPT23]
MRVKQIGDPILREVCNNVKQEDIAALNIQDTINKMRKILDDIKNISSENGNAIAAPQVGVAVRIILLRIENNFHTMINPSYTYTSEEVFDFEEECFSFYSLRGKVSRHSTVTVEYFDENAQFKSKIFTGEESALVQHEIDHLNGVFFLDKVTDKKSVRSVDYILKDNPAKLSKVKDLIGFMAG